MKELVLMANQDIDDGNDADYPPYLCFQALESDFRVCLGGDFHEHVCQYSFNRRDWFDLPARTYTPAIGILQKVYFRANLTTVPMSASNPNGVRSIGIFSTTKKCRLSGNPTSMLHGMDWTLDNFDTSVSNYGLAYLFQNTKAVSISKDFLNFTSANNRACFKIFYGNEYLKGTIYITKAANTSANGVFMGGFALCKLDSVVISTTEGGWQTYSSAFRGSNIKNIELPATYIYPSMYSALCQECVNLEEAFINGRSLGVSTVESYIEHLNNAFRGCSKLSKVTYLVTNTPFAKKYTNNWLTGVAEDGTIIFNKFITWNPEDYRNGVEIETEVDGVVTKEIITWGIPKNWKVKYCDPANPTDIRGSREEFLEPGGYMALGYIQTNGNQYLDSQILLNGNCKVEIDARPTTSTSTSAYFFIGSSYDTDNSNNNRISINPTNIYNANTRFNGAVYKGNLYREGRNKWAVDNRGIYINDEKVADWDVTPSDFQHTHSFYILADRISTGTGVQLKALTGTRIYGLKVYKNGELVADMIPALQYSTKKPGLYDTVNKRFLANIGEGEFTYQ